MLKKIFKKKKGLIVNTTAVIILLIAFLVLIALSYALISGRISGLISYIKDLFNFGG